MKKLLILSLVLAAAGPANAGWSIVVAGDFTSAIVLGDYLNVDLTYCITSSDPVVIALGAGAPDASGYLDTAANLGITGVPAGVFAEVWGIGSFSAIPNRVGVELFLLSGFNPLDTISVYLVDDRAGALGDLVVYMSVPEPMTMGLLALGALCIRKR